MENRDARLKLRGRRTLTVYMERGRLLFRRSWTGILIYEIEAAWRDDQLYLGQVRVNRDPEQYGEIDDDYDRRLLIYLIVVVLLGEHAPFPAKDEATPESPSRIGWSTCQASQQEDS